MKPTVILNLIDIKNLNTIDSINAATINMDAQEIANSYNTYDVSVEETTDGNNPYVVVSCSLKDGVTLKDRNFI